MTRKDIETAGYQTLISFCPSLNVKYNYQKKPELKQLLLDAFDGSEDFKDSEDVEDDKPVEYSQEILDIVDKVTVSKSERMRLLVDAGITSAGEIAKLTDSHYSFVYTVITKYQKSK